MPLLMEITRFLDSADMAPATFGRRAVNDPRLVFDLKRGREPGKRVSARVRAFIAAYRKGAPCN
ncbi:MAG: hypothetical protein RLN87_14570 [Parasphingopyxis sp.]|uniref:hypothetical protein n=1 Tax=Parasphingopyxis sp. TaxID=1920299 RepID=UPI002618EEF8|nr:hypothetical protein [uncultured Parasphingopyxis sp.]